MLIGGSIGITPTRHELSLRIHNSHHHSGCITAPARAARAAFLPELAAEPIRDRTSLHFDDCEPAQYFVPQRDLPPPATGTHLYVCGPTGFMAWVISEARRLGHADAQIHREYFSAEVDTGGAAFEVRLAKSNRNVTVPAGVPITKALAQQGIRIEVSCEQGVCGTCMCSVIEVARPRSSRQLSHRRARRLRTTRFFHAAHDPKPRFSYLISNWSLVS